MVYIRLDMLVQNFWWAYNCTYGSTGWPTGEWWLVLIDSGWHWSDVVRDADEGEVHIDRRQGIASHNWHLCSARKCRPNIMDLPVITHTLSWKKLCPNTSLPLDSWNADGERDRNPNLPSANIMVTVAQRTLGRRWTDQPGVGSSCFFTANHHQPSFPIITYHSSPVIWI